MHRLLVSTGARNAARAPRRSEEMPLSHRAAVRASSRSFLHGFVFRGPLSKTQHATGLIFICRYHMSYSTHTHIYIYIHTRTVHHSTWDQSRVLFGCTSLLDEARAFFGEISWWQWICCGPLGPSKHQHLLGRTNCP